MTSENQKIFQFGSFILDTQRENLYKDGHQINIQRKWYEILCYLIERYGQTVLKEELIEQLWPGKEISDRNLTQHIYSLRRTLGDNPRNPTFILTIPGKGYAFNHPVAILGAAEVETILGIAPSPLIEQPEAPEADDYAQIKSWFTRRRVLQLLLLFLVMTVIVLAFHPSWWRRAATDQPNYPRLATMVTAPGVKVDPSFSPDGKRIAFASGQSVSSLDLFVTTLTQSMAGPLARLTSHPAADHSPVWSPDGRQIAFLRGNHYDQSRMELIVVPVTGGEEKVIANVWGGLDWSPDGRYLVMIDEEDPEYPATPYLITIDGSQRQPITTSVPGEWQFDSHPRFSPDGRSVAFIRWRGDIDGDIWIADIKTQRLKQVTFERGIIGDFEWSRDGREVIFISGRSGTGKLWRQKIGETTPVPIDSVVGDVSTFSIHPFEQKIVFTQYSQSSTIEFWPIGSTLSVSQQRQDWPQTGWSCRIDAARSDISLRLQTDPSQTLTLGSSRNYLTPRFSPDGKKVLFVTNISGLNQVWVANADCSNPTQLTNINFQGLGSPRWSPDGRRITFDARKEGPADVFVVDSDGTNLRPLGEGYMPSWSADGQHIYFVSNRRRLPQVWKMPVSGGKPVRITTTPSRDPLESSDARLLYFTNVDRLWQRNLETGAESPVPGLENVSINRYWDVTPNGVYYVPTVASSFMFTLHFFDQRTKVDRELLQFRGIPARWVPGITVSPDQQSLAISYIGNVLGEIQILENWR